MNALLLDKDASLRATLADRERALADLTRANADLALRDARARAYAEFVRELKALDVGALATGGLQTLVRLSGAQVGAVYLLDDADRLVPVQATAVDGRAFDHRVFGSEGLPKSVMDRREPVFLSAEVLGEPLPKLDLGVGAAPLRWVLAYPVALGSEGAGAILLAGIHAPADDATESVRDAARQLAVALHNAWTHDRLRDKSIALAEQGERLARANRVKTEFLASMSHELRTPLSAILGFADLLMTSPKEHLSPRARESLERIKRNGEHLLGLINDVLDLAKAETGRVDVRVAPVNVGQLARACVAEVESLRSGKDVRLVADVGDAPVETTTDAQRVRQILLNLLSNAIKFTDQGVVELTVRLTGTEVRLAVRDTGIGIPAHAMKELFQDFHQLEAGDGRRYEGTGVGLALSRRLARALGGEIEVRSREGEGSTFTLMLPRVAPPPAAAESTPAIVVAPPARPEGVLS
jgi:signal transduction histidine kinase